jgi:hypothetical protein
MTREQQIPLQRVHLMMASQAKICSVRIIGSDKYFEVQILIYQCSCAGTVRSASANLGISIVVPSDSTMGAMIKFVNNKH